MGFPKSVVDKALVACGRCCCICHTFCGTNIELHHIVQRANGGSDDFDNCIPLCFNCHASMGKADPKHPKGRHYSKEELIMHRNQWYAQQANTQTPAPSICEGDKKLLEELRGLFSQAEYVLTQHDMAGAFRQNSIEALFRYSDLSDDPFFVFLDTSLEELRQALLVHLRKCVATFRRHLYWNCGANDDLCVSEMWLYNNNEKLCEVTPTMLAKYEEEVHLLTQVAEDTWAAYKLFVQQVRIYLHR